MLAHKGMAVALDVVWAALSRALLTLQEDCTVVFTGHSLGGALAQVCCRQRPGPRERELCHEADVRVCLQLAGARLLLGSQGTARPAVQVRTFGAPLVFAHTAEVTRLDSDVEQGLRDHVHNYILSCDIIPRLLGKGISKLGMRRC